MLSLLLTLLWPLSHAETALQLDLMEGEKPVTKVVSLLETMTQKLEEDQKADEELKEKFECWCKQNNDDKSAAVAAAQTLSQGEADESERARGGAGAENRPAGNTDPQLQC